MNVLDHIRAHARDRPEHPALKYRAGSGESASVTQALSYAELVSRFEGDSDRLRAAGAGPGERWGLVAAQGPAFVEKALAILATGACLVPIADVTPGSAIPRAMVEELALHGVLQSGEVDEVSRFSDTPDVDGAGDSLFRQLDAAYMRFTSGTTQARKGVVLGHESVLARLEAANHGLKIGPEDRILWVLPLAHHFVVSILLYLRYGATVVFPESHLARHMLEAVNREEVSVLYASPYHYLSMAKDTSELGLASVRLAVSTADRLQLETARLFRERFGRPLVQALGIIEVGLPVMNVSAAESKPDALGQPLPGYDVWLRDENGKALVGATSPEETGEICIRGSGLLDAYLKPWLPAEEFLEPDGFRTGDQGWFDSDGDLHLAGRRANRISMAGMKFFCEEVEAILLELPEIAECWVHSRDHPKLGAIPVAELVTPPGATPPAKRQLMEHCRARLPAYKIPREFRFVDALPRTSSGKIRRWT